MASRRGSPILQSHAKCIELPCDRAPSRIVRRVPAPPHARPCVHKPLARESHAPHKSGEHEPDHDSSDVGAVVAMRRLWRAAAERGGGAGAHRGHVLLQPCRVHRARPSRRRMRQALSLPDRNIIVTHHLVNLWFTAPNSRHGSIGSKVLQVEQCPLMPSKWLNRLI
jgi:hypothetical protein